MSFLYARLSVIKWLICVELLVISSVFASPLKFPEENSGRQDNNYQQQSQSEGRSLGQSEGRFLNINGVPNGLFNRLTATNNLQDDIGDYDDAVGGGSGITSPSPTQYDVEDRRRHRNRKRPCVPYTPIYRSNQNNGGNPGQGRTFFNFLYNDYNFYGGGSPQHSPQYDHVGGYPCYPLGGGHQRPQRPQRPNRPHYPGSSPLGDDPGNGNRPSGGALGFFGPGGLFDVNMILTNWLRPQSGGSSLPGGALSEPTTGSETATNDVKPVVEINVQDTVQDVV